ncbi:MAG TPA: Stk1 family PASTA domain-containing Ser/Thr kinase [Jatrophihabitantaceae bacterium]
MQTATADPLVGRVLDGRYRIRSRIARGGMSTVYSAVDERLDRFVAIKVMSSGLSADPAFADRFTREARASAKLAHVNTVAVFDQGEDRGHVFLVMELVNGRTLRDLLRERGRLSPAEAVSIMEPVLAALAAAHRAGLVHRDVKPENILLSDDGVVKVADFGLARAVGTEGAATQVGMMMGTVAYCSPEQVSRGNTDQRSDVYSAGIMFFELLTGQAPYVGDSAMAVAYQHVHSRVPAPSSRVAGVPHQLDDLIVRATDSNPAGRPNDAGAFLAELSDIRTELGLPVVPVPSRPRPNGHRPGAANAATAPNPAAGPDVGSTQRLAPGGRVHDTAVGAPVGIAGPGGRPPGPVRPTRDAQRLPPPPTVNPHLAHRRKRRRGLLVILLVFLLIGIAAGFTGWWLVAGRYTHVPDVGGEPRATAVAALHKAGFSNITTSQVNDDTVPRGTVVGTKPGGHSQVRRHAKITLLISLGPKLYKLPDVRGKSQDDAMSLLGQTHAKVTVTQHFDDSVPKGDAIGTDPAAGQQVRGNTPVTLIMSSGPELKDVPDVTGDNQDDATNTLQDAGFEVNVVQQFSDSVDEGKVISQDPPGGQQLAKGHTVTITVSQGSQTVKVPDISSGTTASDARKTLQDAGLKVKIQSVFGGGNGNNDGRKVISVDPPSGTDVHRGDTITLYVL